MNVYFLINININIKITIVIMIASAPYVKGCRRTSSPLRNFGDDDVS